MEKMNNFIKAFGDGISHIHKICYCGKIYYERDEIDEKLVGAIPLDGSVKTITFEGKTYVRACRCWKEKAKLIMGFIDSHNHEIADYLNAEKKRMAEEADSLPTVH